MVLARAACAWVGYLLARDEQKITFALEGFQDTPQGSRLASYSATTGNCWIYKLASSLQLSEREDRRHSTHATHDLASA